MKPHRVLYVALFIAALLTGTRVGVEASSLPQAPTSYTVKQGDTLSAIASRFGSTVQAIKAANGLVNTTIYPGQRLTIPATTGKGSANSGARSPEVRGVGGVSHLVRSGDTLSSIAAQYGTTVDALKRANGLSSDIILVGQTLIVPAFSGSQAAKKPVYVPISAGTTGAACASTYTVRPGDTLSAIAQRCGVTVEALKSINSLGERSILRPGQSLNLPQNEPPVPSAAYESPPTPPTPTPTRVPVRPPTVYGSTTP